MAIPAHIKIVLTGSLPGSETFATGFSLADGPAVNQSVLDGVVDDVYTAIATPGAVATTLRKLLNTASSYQAILGYFYPAGSTAASLTSRKDFVAVGTGTGMLTNQTALVATLRTQFAGRRNRGRMYLPATGVILGTTAQLATPTPQDVADLMSAMLLATTGDWTPVVVSRVGLDAEQISRVTVDSRLDVQRRRANKQLATTSGSATLI